MSNALLNCDNKETFFDNKIIEIIEKKSISSKYFISFLLLKYQCSDIIFDFNNNIKSTFSVRSFGKIIPVGSFLIKEKKIEFLINDNNFEDDLFLNYMNDCLKFNQHDDLLHLKIPFYGKIMLRIASIKNGKDAANIIYRIIFKNKKEQQNLIEKLYFIFININKYTINKNEEKILNELYHSTTFRNFNLNESIEDKINILKKYILLDELIDY